MKVSVVSLALGLALVRPLSWPVRLPLPPSLPRLRRPPLSRPPSSRPRNRPRSRSPRPAASRRSPFLKPCGSGVIDMLRVFGDTGWGKASQTAHRGAGPEEDRGAFRAQQEAAGRQAEAGNGHAERRGPQGDAGELERQEKELQRAQQDAQEEFNQLRTEVQESFNAKLGPILQTLVNEKKITMLFRTTDSGLVFFNQSLDLTAEVIKRFDAAIRRPRRPHRRRRRRLRPGPRRLPRLRRRRLRRPRPSRPRRRPSRSPRTSGPCR